MIGPVGPRQARIALYARVSKGSEQNPETQLLELREWASRSGSSCEEFVDRESSRDRRPMKEEVLRRARVGLIDTIVVVRLDRWGRSMGELVLEMEEFKARGVTFVSLREGLRFDSASGVLLAHLLAAFAAFERELIRERTLAGLARARSEGKAGGRHPHDCGCGARPEGHPAHTGDVLPVRGGDGKRILGWRWPDGREVRKPPPPERGDAALGAAVGGQTPV